MKENMVHNDKMFTLIPEVDGCEHCVFYSLERDGCATCSVPKEWGELTAKCAHDNAIWVENGNQSKKSDDESYTIDEVIRALIDVGYLSDYHTRSTADYNTLIGDIKYLIHQQRDPEYAEYVRLKKKFE